MEERFDAVLEGLHLLAVSPHPPIQQDASVEVGTEPLRHCDTDTTLVESTRGTEKNKNIHAQIRKSSSPKLSPTEFAIALSSTVTRSSDKSQGLELPNESPRMIPMDYTPIPSKSCTQNETASREFLEAVNRKDITCMKSLLDSDLKPDIEYSNPDNDKRRTPLLLAVQLGHIEMVKFLLSRDAQIEAKDESGTTPLMTAASLGKVDIMKELVLQGADVQARNRTRRTALHLAIQKSRDDRAISFLLNLNNTDQCVSVDHRKAIDVNASDKSGKTPLHYCAELGMLEAATMLLDRHANFDAHDEADKAPAYYAIKSRKYFIVELLLKHKANFSQQWPPESTSKEIEELLKRQGYRRPSLENGSSKNEGAGEGPERRGPRERKGSWISSQSSKFRKKSNANAKDQSTS
ncbi:hypothetical protein JMJ35_007517 [Cladonia borealis]|uniref:Ankyrin repeat protein n=1 Tax=Cladonia borealis TaxID=184061 RepID=A0AA39QVW0_9LECA|nr:hypothetical protein JMJ35_007517 [Cladonia borealis]